MKGGLAPYRSRFVFSVTVVVLVALVGGGCGSGGGGGGGGGTVPEVPGDLIPPSGSSIPPVDPTVPTDFAKETEFLYSGENPVQQGVPADAIDPVRAGVLRGRALDRDGSALAGVAVTVLGHPEYGTTATGEDGWFDLAVNGGGALTAVYAKAGYLPAQRRTTARWRDYTVLPDVVLVPADDAATTIDLSSGASAQVHRATVATDGDGSRRATLIVPEGGNAAKFHMPDGSTVSAGSTLTVRTTEYTVGETGPAAMPGALPATSAYTYAVELTADEAVAAGAASVSFDPPLAFYLENFLGFPAGSRVPTGSFDRSRGTWVPVGDGRVVTVVAIAGGSASLDIDGDGTADDASALGVTDGELRRLAEIYSVGDELWRVPVPHFSPWDCNFPSGSGVADDAVPPGRPAPRTGTEEGGDDPPVVGGHGELDLMGQILHESVPVTGTPFLLHYASDRVPGRSANRTMTVSLSGDTVPASMDRIVLEIQIAGRVVRKTFPALPNQDYTYTWDGKDAYGRTVQGGQPAEVMLAHFYRVYYGDPVPGGRSFGLPAVNPTGTVEAREPVPLAQRWRVHLGRLKMLEPAVGGLSLTVHHLYDARSGVLYYGDGTRRTVGELTGVVERIGGEDYVRGTDGNDGPAKDAHFYRPDAVAYGPDGSLYVTDSALVRKIDRAGIVTKVPGEATGPFDLTLSGSDITFGPDGWLYYLADLKVMRTDLAGTFDTLGGTGEFPSGFESGEGGPALDAAINPRRLAVGPDGSVYFLGNDRNVRKISTDGILTTIASGPELAPAGKTPWSLAVAPDGSLYVGNYSDERLRRIGPDGAGPVDGQFAVDIAFDRPLREVAVGPEGTVYFHDTRRIYRLTPEGIVRILVGPDGRDDPTQDAERPDLVSLDPGRQRAGFQPNRLAASPDGRVTFTLLQTQAVASQAYSIWRLESPLPGYDGNDYLIASEDGTAVYAFDSQGRHLRTVHALTGETLFEFGYDGSGRLATVTDGDGNETKVGRDAAGRPTGIVSPYGVRTALTTNGNGYVTGITNPAGETTTLGYGQGGLLTSVTGARGVTYTFAYDELGRLTTATDPEGGTTSLTRTDFPRGHEVRVTSPLGRTSTYRTETLLSGARRRLATHADGTTTETVSGSDGGLVVTEPDGTVTTTELAGDSRFGMQSPVPAKRTVKTPSGLTLQATASREVVLSDPLDLLNVNTLTTKSSVNGRTWTNVYDGATRTDRRTTPEGRGATVKFDRLGRAVSAQTDGLFATTFAYDSRGRLTSRTEGTGGGARVTTFTYDSAGRLSRVTDPLGRKTDFAYDGADRVIRQTQPDGRQVGLAYDGHGNLTSLTPPGRSAHAFSYDSLDLRSSYSPPKVGGATANTSYEYDPDRAETTLKHSDGRSIATAYDTAGRISAVDITPGRYAWSWSPTTGRVTGVSAPSGDASLAFGRDGPLDVSTTWSGAVAGTVSRTFDASFRTTSLSVNGSAAGFTYDDDDNPVSAGGLSLTWNAGHGRLMGTSVGTLSHSFTYDGFGNPTRQTAKSGSTTIFDRQYVHDALDRLTKVTETVNGTSKTIQYGYDTAGRLATVDVNGSRQATYTYDANGNRTDVGSYDARDRLTSVGSTSYTYRVDGELRTKKSAGNTTSYDYDELGSLRKVTLPSGTVIDYVIDAAGRRVGKRVDGSMTWGLLYRDDLKPVAELDGSGNVVSRFVYASRSVTPDLMIRTGGIYRIISDHLGSPRLVVDVSSGAIAQELDYDAFGKVVKDTNPGFQPFGFAGGIYDVDTGLTRFGARDYDAETGRFTARDPVLFDGAQSNLYAYAGNNPVNLVDPSGLGPGGPEDDPVLVGDAHIVIRVSGKVLVKDADSNRYLPVISSRRVSEGAVVRTMEDGIAQIRTGNRIGTLGPDTTLNMSDFLRVARARAREQSLRQRLRQKVRSFLHGPDRLNAENPLGAPASRG